MAGNAGSQAGDSQGGSTGGTSGSKEAGASQGGSSDASCGASPSGATFEATCLACATSPCEQCLCTGCTEQLKTCNSTPGCPEIAVCIRQSGCKGIDCYCGTIDALTCVAGQANGPCKSVILAAPGGHQPSLQSPSGGPASDAALAIGTCAQQGPSCSQVCAK
jgi:hypothetical protein